jgi:hypothetical protein
MAYSNIPIFLQALRDSFLQLTNATGTTVTTIFTAGAQGTKVENIIVFNSDVTIRNLAFYFVSSSTNYLLGTLAIPASAGSSSSIPAVSVLESTQMVGLAHDPFGNSYLYVAPGNGLAVATTTTITSPNFINITCSGGDF